MRTLSPANDKAMAKKKSTSTRESMLNILLPFNLLSERFVFRIDLWRESHQDEKRRRAAPWKRFVSKIFVYGLIFFAVFLFLAGIGFVLYLIKSALGIDIIPDHHIFGE